MPDTISVLIDTEQRRETKPRITMTAAGYELTGTTESSVWCDPVTKTLWLVPYCLTPTWHTSSAGVYSRLALTDFGLSAGSGGWEQKADKPAGATRLYNPAGVSTNTVSSTTYGVNRGWFASFYCFDIGNSDAAVYFEWGISNGGSGATGVSLRFFAGGTVDVYKDAVFLKRYKIGILGGQQTANKYVDLIILPQRRRELLVYSITGGDGFVHVFDDIAEDATSPEIFADQKVWFKVPNNKTVDVEIAPLKFPTSGYAISDEYALMSPPATSAPVEAWVNVAPAAGITNARVVGDPAYAGTTAVSAIAPVKVDGTTFTPNGTLYLACIKTTLTGDGSYTPFVYGVHYAWKAAYDVTSNAEEFDISQYIVGGWTLDVPDDPGGVSFKFTLQQPDTLESGDVALLKTLDNRPCKVKLGTLVILDGVLMPPKYMDAVDDDARRLSCEIKDRTYQMRKMMIRERIPIDGFDLSKTADATTNNKSLVQLLYSLVGIPYTAMDLDNITYKIDSVPPAECGKWNSLIDVGAQPYDEMTRAVDTYAAGYLWGIKPTSTGPKAYFKDPDLLSTTPDLILYRTQEDAVAASAPKTQCYDDWDNQPLEIEANEVRVTGYNPRTGKIIQAYKEDVASKTISTVPSARPDNWLGEARVFSIVDSRLTTIAAVSRVAEFIYPRVTARYYIGEWFSEFLIKGDGAPVWRGDYIELDGARSYRVSALRAEGYTENSTLVVRRATYTGGTILNAGGTTLAEIRHWQQMSAVDKTVVRPGSEFLRGFQATELVAV
jgi:hypothetical protein